MRVYCQNCHYLYDETRMGHADENLVCRCTHRSNMVKRSNWRWVQAYHKLPPSTLNKNGDCANFQAHGGYQHTEEPDDDMDK